MQALGPAAAAASNAGSRDSTRTRADRSDQSSSNERISRARPPTCPPRRARMRAQRAAGRGRRLPRIGAPWIQPVTSGPADDQRQPRLATGIHRPRIANRPQSISPRCSPHWMPLTSDVRKTGVHERLKASEKRHSAHRKSWRPVDAYWMQPWKKAEVEDRKSGATRRRARSDSRAPHPRRTAEFNGTSRIKDLLWPDKRYKLSTHSLLESPKPDGPPAK